MRQNVRTQGTLTYLEALQLLPTDYLGGHQLLLWRQLRKGHLPLIPCTASVLYCCCRSEGVALQ